MPADPQPYRSPLMDIKPEWIDYNGHLNLAYYHVLFDQGIDGLFDVIGLGERYRAERGFTTYTVEAHVSYLHEVPPASRVFVTSQIVGLDAKRLHVFQELFHADGWRAATLESLSLSIDQRGAEGPKAAPFPEDVFARVSAAAREHAKPAPAGPARACDPHAADLGLASGPRAASDGRRQPAGGPAQYDDGCESSPARDVMDVTGRAADPA